MSYKIESGKLYATQADVLAALGLDAGAALPAGIEVVVEAIIVHDPMIQRVEWDYNDDGSVNGLVAVGMTKEESDLARDDLKRGGSEYANTGVVVPFESADALALMQVKTAFELGADYTVIRLSNGQRLPMNAADFPAFAGWFVRQRNRFYQG
jgi:hypothetical protein